MCFIFIAVSRLTYCVCVARALHC